LEGIARYRTRADKDFVPADQIAKLADLSTLDLSNFRDVRDRLITFALSYDCALRIGEVARLLLDDVRVSAFVEIILRGEIQKGTGNGCPIASQAEPRAAAPDIKVPEMDAMARIRSLGINWRAMRDYAIGEKAVVERRGKAFYSEAFLDRLCSEWMTKDEAMRLMGITAVSAYQYRARNHGIGTLVIGKASLAKTSDVIRSLRRAEPLGA
jgi:hypothetical protein